LIFKVRHDFLMVSVYLHVIALYFQKASHEFLVFSVGLVMFPKGDHGFPMVLLRSRYVFPMTIRWLSTICRWFPYGSVEVSYDSHLIPCELLMFPKISMAPLGFFLWFHYGFPLAIRRLSMVCGGCCH